MALEATEWSNRNLGLPQKKLGRQQTSLVKEEEMDHFLKRALKRKGFQQEVSGNERQHGGEAAVKGNRAAASNAITARDGVTRVIESIQDIDRTIEHLIQVKKGGPKSDISESPPAEREASGNPLEGGICAHSVSKSESRNSKYETISNSLNTNDLNKKTFHMTRSKTIRSRS